MRNFRDLRIWHDSIDLVVDVYHQTEHFPREEVYGITRQLRRSAVSTASNIAEGCSRSSQKDFRHFLEMSMGSTYESETQLVICKRLDFIAEEDLEGLLMKMHSLQSKINLFMKRTKDF